MNAGHVRVYAFPKSTVGLPLLKDGMDVNIYPNPTTGIFKIDSELNGEVVINLYDVTGKRVFHKSMWFNNTPIELNIEDLDRGSYRVVIEAERGRTSGSLILPKLNSQL